MANIFVIDDESILLDLISNALRLDGHKVTTFSEPMSMLAVPGCPLMDLLVTDVEMRPINGFEVAKRLIMRGFQGPILFMSGYSYPRDSSDRRLVIEKPFTAGQLRAAVSKALRSLVLPGESARIPQAE